MIAATNSKTEQHLVEGDSRIRLTGSEAGDLERERRWQAKVAVGGNNPGQMKAANNSNTEQHLAEGSSRILLAGSEAIDSERERDVVRPE